MDQDGASMACLSDDVGLLFSLVSCGFFLLLSGLKGCIALVELLYATGRVNDLLLAGEEGMTFGTDFQLQVRSGRTRHEGRATTTYHFTAVISGVEILFHCDTFQNFRFSISFWSLTCMKRSRNFHEPLF